MAAALKTTPLVIGLLLAQIPSAPRPLTDADAYAIYAVVVPSEAPARAPGARRLVIQSTTDDDKGRSSCEMTGPDVKGEWAEAIADFRRRNATAWTIARDLPLDMPYDLATRDEIAAAFKGRGPDGWPEFYTAFPGTKGYIQLSVVGFDKSRTRALVYTSHYCGNVCGGGAYHFLQRDGEGWKEVHPNISACYWIS